MSVPSALPQQGLCSAVSHVPAAGTEQRRCQRVPSRTSLGRAGGAGLCSGTCPRGWTELVPPVPCPSLDTLVPTDVQGHVCMCGGEALV